MKKIALFLLLLLPVSGYCQNRTTDNLEVLCKVWGFAKYHHPVFADSTADADRELFALLPQIEQAGKKERNRLLTE